MSKKIISDEDLTEFHRNTYIKLWKDKTISEKLKTYGLPKLLKLLEKKDKEYYNDIHQKIINKLEEISKEEDFPI